MTYTTDERLKSFLDTDQLARERMCLAVLASDRRFSAVKPRHPRGGPDGGRDIDAIFQNSLVAFGAVGFLNQANDSDEQKRRAISKFKDDVLSALANEPNLKVFVFFTNINLTTTEKSDIGTFTRDKGISHCEIFDRERIRIFLDSVDGFSVRFQYLEIPLSEAEQATFFAKWGDDIQGLISDGFGKIERKLNRLHFLAETILPLSYLSVQFELDREYLAEEIGHFRTFCTLHLKESREGIVGCLFGATDNSHRIRATAVGDLPPEGSGIGRGRSGGYWEQRLSGSESEAKANAKERYARKYHFEAVGLPKVRRLQIGFGYQGIMRVRPYLLLRDIDEALFAMFLNRSLASKVTAVRIYANEYKLADYTRKELSLDPPPAPFKVPMYFSKQELTDEWVRIMHDLSPFRLSFSDRTPLRMFPPADIEGP